LRPDGRSPAERLVAASRLVTRFIAFIIGMPVEAPSGFSSRSTAEPVAFTVTRAAISSVARPSASRARDAGDPPAAGVDQRRLASTWFASTAPCSTAASA
jgi:hypothetical protein